MEIIEVNGNKESTLFDIELYLSLTSIDRLSPDEIKKSLVEQYLQDYRNHREKNLKKIKQAMGSGSIKPVKNENKISSFPEDCEFTIHGIYMEDIEVSFDSSKPESVVKTPKINNNLPQDNTFTSHGIFMEDIEREDVEIIESEVHSFVSTPKCYVPHGVYIEDIPRGEYKRRTLKVSSSVEKEYGEPVYLEDVDITQDFYEEVNHTSEKEYDYEEEDLTEEVPEDDSVTDSNTEETVDSVINKEVTPTHQISKIPPNRVRENQSISKPEKYEKVINTPKKRQEKVQQVSHKQSVEHIKKQPVEEVPADIREYVKKHQGCKKSEILKYYSAKELEKALKRNKIFESRGTLRV